MVSGRLLKFNGVESEVLYPPLLDPQRYRTGACGDYILYISRLVSHKRQELAIQAMRHTRTPVKLVIAGQADMPDYEARLRDAIARHNLADRVTLLARWIPEDDKIGLFADCLACMYIPFDEDSYGYPSLEAHHAGKAVLTTADSGGPLELIVDGENGLVAEPEPAALAAAMDKLWRDRNRARRMGEAGRAPYHRPRHHLGARGGEAAGVKIAVVNNWAPFVRGGAEHLAEALTRKLQETATRRCW